MKKVSEESYQIKYEYNLNLTILTNKEVDFDEIRKFISDKYEIVMGYPPTKKEVNLTLPKNKKI